MAATPKTKREMEAYERLVHPKPPRNYGGVSGPRFVGQSKGIAAPRPRYINCPGIGTACGKLTKHGLCADCQAKIPNIVLPASALTLQPAAAS